MTDYSKIKITKKGISNLEKELEKNEEELERINLRNKEIDDILNTCIRLED